LHVVLTCLFSPCLDNEVLLSCFLCATAYLQNEQKGTDDAFRQELSARMVGDHSLPKAMRSNPDAVSSCLCVCQVRQQSIHILSHEAAFVLLMFLGIGWP